MHLHLGSGLRGAYVRDFSPAFEQKLGHPCAAMYALHMHLRLLTTTAAERVAPLPLRRATKPERISRRHSKTAAECANCDKSHVASLALAVEHAPQFHQIGANA